MDTILLTILILLLGATIAILYLNISSKSKDEGNGAEQIATRARDCGIDITYEGIRLTPVEIVDAAISENVHVIGLSILSGSHTPLVKDVITHLKEKNRNNIPVVVGGIIPEKDAIELKKSGVSQVYTPKDFELNKIISDLIEIVDV